MTRRTANEVGLEAARVWCDDLDMPNPCHLSPFQRLDAIARVEGVVGISLEGAIDALIEGAVVRCALRDKFNRMVGAEATDL